MAIAKKIHYIWAGPKKFGRLQKRCIASWRKYAPDYEIKLWNENNFPLMNHPYIKEMYKKKKWAFVSDFMRFWILYHEGGVYLDTDMELLRPIDDLFDARVLLADGHDNFISSGIIASEPKDEFIRRVLDFYLNDKEYSTANTSPKVITEIYNSYSAKNNIKVMASEYFYPCLPDEWFCDKEKLKKAYGRHLWGESWVRFRFFRKLLRKFKLIKFFKKYLKSQR